MMNKLHKLRQGFNLVEAAIVLGVVGLVIGGIWVAASTATEAHRINETAKGVMAACERIGSVFPRWGANSGYADDIKEASIRANIFPGDWVSGTNIITPIGAPIQAVDYWGSSTSNAGLIGIVVGADNASWRPGTPAKGFSEGQCRKFISQIVAGRRPGVETRLKFFMLFHSSNAVSPSFSTIYYLDSPGNLSPRETTVSAMSALCEAYNEFELMCTN